jgi:transcription initiation factor TFIIIB Brf1 subunit/transcription initiation factor TFIIB
MIGWGIYGPGMVDGTGRKLTPDEYARSKRYNWFERRNTADPSLLNMVRIVEGTTARLHLPKTVGLRAVEIYRKARTAGIKRPLQRIGVVAVYIACRESHIPISMTEIVSPCDRRLVWKTHNRIIFALNLKVPLRDGSRDVPRVVAAANLPYRVERGAIALLGKLSETNWAKKSLATVLAAATVYLCSRQMGLEISKRQIASAAHVNESTVGEYCRLIAATASFMKSMEGTPETLGPE